MADRQGGSTQTQRPTRPTTTTNDHTAFLRRLHENSPNSTRLIGFLTLLISGAILLFLTGVTVTATFLGLIFFTPLLFITSPIWVPLVTVIFVAVAGFLSLCGFGMVTMAVMSWMYRYFRGFHPPGSDQVDYARNRIADTANHVKDYARVYGGYLHSRVKDAAPGA
ncbi:oleosin 1-like [Camellia sinensis]|uniref:Oleosin n=1 Tax=Camellia sinensis var. sinensis TaxID=542762 RepID=A0A4S4EXZ1_CAMSN|nr:oleosin 1-like [Camellia sinensis]THG21612.1 hypothetical protein TEA_019625 [Camellia sinensis var. sinensis]